MSPRTCISVERKFSHDLPNELEQDDLRLSEQVIRYLLERYSSTGDAVFDPFAGFGTTLLVAERLGRAGYGIECDRKRWSYAQQLLVNPDRMMLGDARVMNLDGLPRFSLSLSSPIYMNSTESLDPLSGFTELGDYETYISSLVEIYSLVAAHSVAGAHLVVEAANLKRNGTTTMFAWDLAKALADTLRFEGELVLDWGDRGYGFGYDHSYCLIFRA